MKKFFHQFEYYYRFVKIIFQVPSRTHSTANFIGWRPQWQQETEPTWHQETELTLLVSSRKLNQQDLRSSWFPAGNLTKGQVASGQVPSGQVPSGPSYALPWAHLTFFQIFKWIPPVKFPRVMFPRVQWAASTFGPSKAPVASCQVALGPVGCCRAHFLWCCFLIWGLRRG
jgi:hypothetical protein